MSEFIDQFELDLESLENVNGGLKIGMGVEPGTKNCINCADVLRAEAELTRVLGTIESHDGLGPAIVRAQALKPYIYVDGNVAKYKIQGKEVSFEEFIRRVQRM